MASSVEFRRATTRIDAIAEHVRDLTPANEAVGEYMLLEVDERFATQTDPDGIPWIPNSAFTLAEKRRKGRIMKVLQDTGAMRRRTGYTADRQGVTIHNRDRKAVKHQYGIGVPRRRFMGVNERNLTEIREIYRGYIIP